MSKNRFLAVSDVHGCSDLLTTVLKQARYDPRTDQLILLGDYIDRGDKSFQTVKLVKSLTQDGAVALMGNHEDMAIKAFESGSMEHWYSNGGHQTVWSYAQNKAYVEDELDFFKSLPLFYETPEYIFVHAGINPNNPIPANSRNTLLWTREEWLYSVYDGKPVVYGHTPARKVRVDAGGKKIGIDTGAVFWGMLSCLELPKMIVYTASNQTLAAV